MSDTVEYYGDWALHVLFTGCCMVWRKQCWDVEVQIASVIARGYGVFMGGVGVVG